MLGKHYNPKKPHKGILLFDVVNEYGFCMEQYLPVGKFNFDPKIEKYTPQYIMNIPDNSKYGAFLEVLFIYLSNYCFSYIHTNTQVSLEYPEHLHFQSTHTSFPLAPEKITITEDHLSSYQKQLAKVSMYTTTLPRHPGLGMIFSFKYYYFYYQELGIDVNAGKVSKLVTTLNDKERIVIHHKNLQQYLALGLRLKAVHKVATFEQAPWLASYIQKTTQLRRQSKDAFQKAFAKLMINAVFG